GGVGGKGGEMSGDGGDEGHWVTDKLMCDRRQPVVAAIRPPILEGDIAALAVAHVAQALTQDLQEIRVGRRRAAAQDADYGHRLRARRERRGDGGRRAAEHRNELAPSHSITSSARSSRPIGSSRPSSRAAFPLMTS